jgi:hypothetical protein
MHSSSCSVSFGLCEGARGWEVWRAEGGRIEVVYRSINIADAWREVLRLRSEVQL